MKTQIVTVFAAIVLTAGITKNVTAAPVKNETITVLNDVAGINKIEIYGNVELYISDGPADEVKVYDKYYSDNALVQNKNGVLRISSYKKEKMIVWVTANDLRAVSAFDNAQVKSFGNLSKIEFAVDLHNNATAQLKLDAYSTSVIVNDKAKASLSGSTSEYELKYANTLNVDQQNFKAKHQVETNIALTNLKAAETDELADLR